MKTTMSKLMVCVGLLMSLALAAQAGQYWWSGNGTILGGSGTWSADPASNNWSTTGVAPFGAWPNNYTDEAVFTNTSGATVTLSGTIKAGALTIYTNNLTLTGGLLDFGSSVATINLPNPPPSGIRIQAYLNSPLSGSGGLAVISAGTASGNGYGFKLLGNNSGLSGKLEVQVPAGRVCDVFATNDFNFGAVPAVYTPDALKFTGGGFNLNGGSFTIPANRGITVNASGLTFYQAGPYILNSRITGSGALSVNNTTVTFNQQNDFAGNITLQTSKAIMGVDNALPHGFGKGLVVHNYGASLDLNGYNLTVNGFAKTYLREFVIYNTNATPVTLTVGDGNTTSTLEGAITNGPSSGALSVEKIGSGTTTLQVSVSNRTANVYSGTTTVRSGTLLFDQINATNELHDGALTLAGGTLGVYGAGPTTNASQTFTHGTLTLLAGGNGLTITNRGGNAALTVGSIWTRTNGASLFVSLLGTGTSTLSSSPALTNGIVGGYAFVKDSTDVDFATVSGGNVVRYTGATLLDATAAAADLDGTKNYYVSAGQTLTGSATTQTVNSIRLNQCDLTMNGKVLVVGSGGIIFSNNASVKGIGDSAGNGTVTAPAGSDLVVYMFSQSSNNQRIMANISDNNGPVGVTIAADSGSGARLRLDGVNTYSGDTVINGGGLYGVKIPYGSGKGNLVINSGGTADLAAGDVMVNGLSASPGNAGGTLNNTYSGTATNTLTVGHGDASATYPGTILKGATRTVALIKVGSGTQTLSGMNTYNGGTILSNGVLNVSSTNNIGGAKAAVTFAGGTLQINGAAFTSLGATPLTFTSAGGGLDIADAGNSFTLTNNLATGTVLTKTGAGMLTLTGTQLGTINTDDPSKISFGAGLGFYNLGLTSGGVFSPSGNGTIGTLAVNNDLTFSGKLLVDVTSSTNDTVTAGGTITLSAGATLEIVNTSLLNRSKSYTLLTAGVGPVSVSSLTALNLPALWKLKAVGNTVVLYYASGTMISFM